MGLVLGTAFLLLSFGAATVPLLDPDEARFARTSLEMLRRGDPVVPHFEGRPRLVKPPLMHWIQSTLFGMLGPQAWVARLPAGLATLGSMLLLGQAVRRRFGAEGAVWAAAVLATTPLVLVVGRLGTLDALLGLHVFAVVALDLADPAGGGSRGHLRALTTGALLGLGFLVKGPVGVVVPLLILLAGRTATRREVWPGGALLAQAVAGWSVVVLPWGLALIARTGWAAVAEVIRGEALGRFLAGTTHHQPFWYYGVVLLIGFFPWIGPLLLALPRLLFERGASTARYAAAGLVVALVFFSLSRSKLPNYIAPLAPLAAIVVVSQLNAELRDPRRRVAGSALLGATLAAFALLFAMAAAPRLDGAAARVAWIAAAIHGVGALATLPGLWLRRPRWVYGTAAATSAVFLFIVVAVLLPEIARTRTSAYLIRDVPQLAAVERELWMIDMKVPSLTWYLDRVPEEVAVAELPQRLNDGADPLLVFDEDDLAGLDPATRAALREVGRQGKYVVLEKIEPRSGSSDAGSSAVRVNIDVNPGPL